MMECAGQDLTSFLLAVFVGWLFLDKTRVCVFSEGSFRWEVAHFNPPALRLYRWFREKRNAKQI